MGVLTVKVLKVTDLPNLEMFGVSDPYGVIQLEQENGMFDRSLGKHTTSKKENDLNPVYNETFTFEIPALANMRLNVSVYDDNRSAALGNSTMFDSFFGKAAIELGNRELSETPTELSQVIKGSKPDPKNKPGAPMKMIEAETGKLFLELSFKE